MKIVVTGGAGFIGSNLARTLIQRQDVSEVRVVDDLSTGFKANLDGLALDFHEGSILDPDLLDEVFHGADAVVHLAALPSVPRSVRDPVANHHANVTGTLQVLEAARRAGNLHVIAASSSSVYGANPVSPKHEGLRAAPLSPYAVTKLATEAYLSAYHHCYDLPVLPFRLFNVYGPGQSVGHSYAAVIPTWTTAILDGEPVAVHGDGTQSRDFTYVGTVSQVLAEAAVRRVVHADPVNLAFGTRTSLLTLIAELESATGKPALVHHGAPRTGDVEHSSACGSLLRSIFPEVQPTALREGLHRTIQWFRSTREALDRRHPTGEFGGGVELR
ncbi:NAD-dependent epimerase/dehydratase family protein [Kitasatospora viridis]|uniref:UDP-glucose 4-epimerase n=1 Tax=Kitasatospora viridis TaxID=281105 RepID=A0A561SDV2_9ACTN|nr:NAD-dependent epimerase/dehydratase family protein [Kitasatospora viridis]TWF73046.1 UDP-glucose 4-epimerase [Kitasatospora viridis]